MARIRLSSEQILSFTTDVKEAEKRIEDCYMEQWARVEESYYGSSRTAAFGVADDPGAVNFNFLLATANTIIPSILATDPHIGTRARSPKDIGAANIGEAALGDAYRQGKAHNAVSQITLDAELFGVGIGRVVYNPAGNTTPLYHYDQDAYFELEDEDDGTLSNVLAEAMEEDGFDVAMDESPDVPTLTRISPRNFLFPSGADDIARCPWVADKQLVRLTELRMVPNFRVPSSLDATEVAMTPAAGSMSGARQMLSGATPEFVTVYEIHYWVRVKKTMRRRILWLLDEGSGVDTQDRVLHHMEDDSGMRGYPFVMLRTVMSPGRMYEPRIADLAAIHPIAERLNDELAAVLRHHRAASKQKYVALPGALSEDSKLGELLASDADMDVCELPSNVSDIRQALQLVPIAPMSNDVPWVIGQLQRLMYEISGVDVYQRGGVGRKGTSATEVAAVSAGFQNRAAVRKRAVEVFIEQVAHRFLDTMRHYWSDARWIRVTGEDGADEFVAVDSNVLRGLYDIEVSVSEYDPKEQANEVAAFNGLLQTISGTMQAVGPLVQAGILPQDTISKFVDKAFGIWKQDKRRLVGPLSGMMSPVAGGAGGGPAPVDDGSGGGEDMGSLAAMLGGGGGQVNGNGYDPASGGGLAGTGPRPGAGETI